GRQSRLGGPAVRLNQEDHVARMRELRSGMSCDGDDLGPDPTRDIRHLNRAHRRAGVRHNQDGVAIAHNRRDRLSDEVAVIPSWTIRMANARAARPLRPTPYTKSFL